MCELMIISVCRFHAQHRRFQFNVSLGARGQVWDRAAGTFVLKWTLDGHGAPVNAVATDSIVIVTGSDDNVVRVS